MRDNPFEQAGMIAICARTGSVLVVHAVNRLIRAPPGASCSKLLTDHALREPALASQLECGGLSNFVGKGTMSPAMNRTPEKIASNASTHVATGSSLGGSRTTGRQLYEY